ncbi:MAG: ABC-F family ATP-binding cassette domain-containing protein [Pseudomonadota bacterium]
MIRFDNIHFSYSGKPVLTGASAALPNQAKVALVGPNGAGKSTLLKLIDGTLHAAQGDLEVPSRVRLKRLEQSIPDPSLTVLDVVIRAHDELYKLRRLVEDHSQDPDVLADAHSRLYELGDGAADAKAASILSGLGFSTSDLSRPIGDFSGGWQMRASLAGILFAEPDYMLLDEPTNYLDLEGALWLENHLASYPRGWVLISHDRDMLSTAPSHILHMSGGKTTLYTGQYERFLAQWSARKAQTEKEAAKLAAKKAHMEKFVERFRAKASKAKQAQSRLKALEKLGSVETFNEDGTVEFTLPQIAPLPPPIITLEGASAGYEPGKPVIKDMSLRIDQDDRIALLGPNGRGKSTFAKLLSGQLSAMGGSVRRASKLKIGFFTQHQVDVLDSEASPLTLLARHLPDLPPAKLRARLAQFGFDADMAERPSGTLSGGQRARLLFAIICADNPQMLILDEPTNHLDIASREHLARAISAYEGAVLIISHDRSLVDMCADRLWVVEDQTVKRFDDSLDAYRKKVLQGDTAQKADKSQLSASERKAQRKEAAQRRKSLAPLRIAVKETERAMEALSLKTEQLRTKLADPALYDSADQSKAIALQKDLGTLETQLAQAEEAWMAATERYEAAMAEAEAA